jgi:Right handed beta helix region
MASLASVSAAGGIVYVDANLASGADDGTSWQDAFQGSDGLRQAIQAAQSGDEVWAAMGTYKPTAGASRFLPFRPKNGVGIYGGFLGNETSRDQRDYETNETILTGDLMGNDSGLAGLNDNSYNVVNAGGTNVTARLDGFTITGGNANHASNFTSQVGAGVIFLSGSSPTIANCRFIGNRTVFGGGAMYFRQSSPTILNCWFENNNGGNFGGAFDVFNASSPTVTDCVFKNNRAFRAGGVEIFGNCNPILTRCYFEGNLASGGTAIGGAMYIANGGIARMNDCTFIGNTARNGAGVYNDAASPRFRNCVFADNNTSGGSGQGGGMYNTSASPQIHDSLFVGNSARLGGAMRNLSGSNPQLTNCSVVENEATGTGTGGGLSNSGTSPIVRNAIFWNNSDNSGTGTSAQINQTGAGGTAVRFSDIQGGWTGAGNDNINADPMFIDAMLGDYRISANSPCSDTGDPAFVPAAGAADLDGHPRVLCGQVDMGAYETGMGDADCNDAVDLDDFDQRIDCVTGPGGGPVGPSCEMFDYDGDGDVDFSDAADWWLMVGM